MKFKNQDLHDLSFELSPELIYAWRKINSTCKYLAPLHYVFSAGILWYIS